VTYLFTDHCNGIVFEILGSMELPDDFAAVAFAKCVIKDVLRDNSRNYSNWLLAITEGERLVAGILYAP
jgi:hypothetical protein